VIHARLKQAAGCAKSDHVTGFRAHAGEIQQIERRKCGSKRDEDNQTEGGRRQPDSIFPFWPREVLSFPLLFTQQLNDIPLIL